MPAPVIGMLDPAPVQLIVIALCPVDSCKQTTPQGSLLTISKSSLNRLSTKVQDLASEAYQQLEVKVLLLLLHLHSRTLKGVSPLVKLPLTAT